MQRTIATRPLAQSQQMQRRIREGSRKDRQAERRLRRELKRDPLRFIDEDSEQAIRECNKFNRRCYAFGMPDMSLGYEAFDSRIQLLWNARRLQRRTGVACGPDKARRL